MLTRLRAPVRTARARPPVSRTRPNAAAMPIPKASHANDVDAEVEATGVDACSVLPYLFRPSLRTRSALNSAGQRREAPAFQLAANCAGESLVTALPYRLLRASLRMWSARYSALVMPSGTPAA